MQMLLGIWLMLEICRLSVLGCCMKHCLWLLLCIALRQYGGGKRSRIRVVQMDNLRGLLGMRMDKVYTDKGVVQ